MTGLRIMLATIAILMAAHVHAQTQTQKALIAKWQELNVLCRGGAGDDPGTETACNDRNSADTALAASGCRYHQGDRWACARRAR